MPKKTNQSTNWDFKVRMEPDALSTLPHILTGRFSIVRNDTNQVLGNVSEQYGIVQNADLIAAARQALAKRGLDGLAQENIIVVDNGKRMYATFTFRSGKLSAERAVGDVLGYKIILRNSFDRSKTASFQLGFERLICQNGMVALVPEFSFDEKHNKKATLDFLPDALDEAINSGAKAISLFQELAGTDIDTEKGQVILHNLVKLNAISERLRKKIEPVWLQPPYEADAARNLYNLYNAVTYVITRNVEGDKMERANELNFATINLLSRAARAKTELEKLLVPVSDDQKIMVAVTNPANL